jgi:hypothetical protein
LSTCTTHREYLGAIADGETDLVPPATLAHVDSCADCAREIRAHQLLGEKIHEAGDRLVEPVADRKRISMATARRRAIAAGVAVAMLVAAVGAGWFELSRSDPVQAAVAASAQPLQVESTDPLQVGQWCFQASGRTLPAIQLDGMHVVGARMDRSSSTDIVSVRYSAPSGARVTVSWLEGQAPSGSGVEDRNVAGQELLIVHASVGTAVITGSSGKAMWQTAAAIETSAT